MFRHDLFGLKAPPPELQPLWLPNALLKLWLQIRPGLLQRLESDFFNRSLPYADNSWWFNGASTAQWQHWYQQNQSLWLVWQNICRGGRARPEWSEDKDTALNQLELEADQLWYLWACQLSGTAEYPSASQLIASLKQWLGTPFWLEKLDIEVSIQHGMADGLALLQQTIVRHWPLCIDAMQQGRWLPVRCIAQQLAPGIPACTSSLALLLYQLDTADSILCYEPATGKSGRLVLTDGNCALELDEQSHSIAALYPLAASQPAIKAGLGFRIRRWFGS
jgi:hypothetical protein